MRLQDRIGRVAHIEVDRAVACVDHHLDGVADAGGAAAARLGVGEPGGWWCRCPASEQAPAARDKIRVMVEGQERGDRAHAVLDVAVEQDAALIGDVAGEQDVDIGKAATRTGCAAGSPPMATPSCPLYARWALSLPLG